MLTLEGIFWSKVGTPLVISVMIILDELSGLEEEDCDERDDDSIAEESSADELLSASPDSDEELSAEETVDSSIDEDSSEVGSELLLQEGAPGVADSDESSDEMSVDSDDCVERSGELSLFSSPTELFVVTDG